MKHKGTRLNFAAFRTLLSACGVAVVLVAAMPSAWANWQVSPELSAGIEYDDNTRLNDVAGLSNSDTGYGLQARATFFYDTQRTDLRITPRLRSKWYSDNSVLDSNDQFLRFDFSHNGQKSRLSLRGDYSSESVRTAERSDVDFDVEDPDDILEDDSGRTLDTGKRDRLKLAPKFAYQFSERTTLVLDAEYRDTSYDSDVSLLLGGYTETFVGTQLAWDWTTVDTVSLSAYVGKYEAERSEIDLASKFFGVGYGRKISERSRFNLFVGSDASEDQAGEEQSNFIGEVSIVHRYATMNVLAAYRRAVSGSGVGGLTVRDSFSLNVSRSLSERFTLSGGLRAYSTKSLNDSTASLEKRDYLQFRALARWHLSRKLSVDLDYRFTDIDRQVTGAESINSESNRVSLWFNWHPKPLRR